MGIEPNLLPPSGAWKLGDPVGDRKFFSFSSDRSFALDTGTSLQEVTLAYETWGELNSDQSNAVLICHAWTGDSHAAGRAMPGHPTPGWWNEVVGPGKAIDTREWFVVCSNVLGGCQGSTGPASPHPEDGAAYGSRFPIVTIRDMVRAQARLQRHLGIEVWASVIGGSMGGMQSLEWAVTFPRKVRSFGFIASCLHSSAQQIAWGAIGRRAIRLDPRWRGGDYYEAGDGDGPSEGLNIARQIAQVTFRSDNAFTDKFGRDRIGASPDGQFGLWNEFEVERYLDYHGNKLVRRFDANSYLLMSKAMDLHDIGRGRGNLEAALSRATMPSVTIGISSDILFPMYQQRQAHELLISVGAESRLVEIDSPHGHDGFLIDSDSVGNALLDLLDRVS